MTRYTRGGWNDTSFGGSRATTTSRAHAAPTVIMAATAEDDMAAKLETCPARRERSADGRRLIDGGAGHDPVIAGDNARITRRLKFDDTFFRYTAGPTGPARVGAENNRSSATRAAEPRHDGGNDTATGGTADDILLGRDRRTTLPMERRKTSVGQLCANADGGAGDDALMGRTRGRSGSECSTAYRDNDRVQPRTSSFAHGRRQGYLERLS